ncbi:Probable E3 ubiquitin-protein ligase MGRN1 (Mahogunin RING finger protein 1) (RING-type E3 ubiquitin transferase MGRN1), partial [Durusdinium trenchii]
MGGHSSRTAPDLPLPHQEVVSLQGSGGRVQDRPAGYLAAANTAARLAQKCETGQVKVQLAWLPHSFQLQKGPSRHLWEIHGTFTAEGPCTLSAHFHCRERTSSSGVLRYEAADTSGPPSWSASYPAGKHELRLAGDKAIDFQRWPLEVFWKLKHKRMDVIPVVFVLDMPGVQSIVHISLEVSKEAALNLQLKLLRQKVVIDQKEYLLEEIYGLADLAKEDGAHDESSHGEPCVVCLSDPRTTAILPCRHLCLCEECARELSIGAQLRGDTCPICRGKIQ